MSWECEKKQELPQHLLWTAKQGVPIAGIARSVGRSRSCWRTTSTLSGQRRAAAATVLHIATAAATPITEARQIEIGWLAGREGGWNPSHESRSLRCAF